MNDTRYERPTTVEEACALLAEAPDRTKVLAGGTDLLVDLRAGGAHVALLVDIKRIPGMTEISWTPGGDLVIGAAVTMRQICEDAQIARRYPALADGAGAVGSLQVRCRATIGGNLCNASPCADTAPSLLVLGAQVKVAGYKGERQIELAELFIDVKRSALDAGEIATAIIVPAAARASRSAFEKIKRVRGHDLALVNAAAAYSPSAGQLRAAIGSCGVTPLLLPRLENIAPGADVNQVAEQLATQALQHIRPIDDVRATAEYRRDMVALLCRRLARRLLSSSGDGR
jgi:carbon-monoxide dehydrogenase medium subunit